jgi:hypothetical protein
VLLTRNEGSCGCNEDALRVPRNYDAVAKNTLNSDGAELLGANEQPRSRVINISELVRFPLSYSGVCTRNYIDLAGGLPFIGMALEKMSERSTKEDMKAVTR